MPLPFSRIRLALLMVTALAVLLATAPQASAQTNQDRRKQFVQGLLENLIQSQTGQPVPQSQPLPPPAPAARPAAQPAAADPRGFETALKAVVDESARLVSALYADASRQPGLRSALSDAMKINAAASVLQQRALQLRDPRLTAGEFQSLDRDWRVLAARLPQTPGVSPATRQSLDRMNQYEQALNRLYGVPAQLNYTELFRLASEMAANLGYLTEDLEMEMQRSDIRDQYVLEGGRVEQQARLLADAVGRQLPYENIVGQFRVLSDAWTPFTLKLRPLESRYIERDMRRVWQVHRQLQELLWLPPTFDPQQLANLAQILKGSIDALFEAVTLNQLIELPGARTVIPVAGEFYGTCEYFLDCAQRGRPQAELVAAFRDIEASWSQTRAAFSSIPAPATQQTLTEIDYSMTALREALGLRAPWDPQRAMQLAAALESQGMALESGMKSRLMGPSGYLGSFRVEFLTVAARMNQASRSFREGLVQGLGDEELRRRSAAIASAWQQLSAYAPQLKQREKDFLAGYSAQVTPALVELQTMFQW